MDDMFDATPMAGAVMDRRRMLQVGGAGAVMAVGGGALDVRGMQRRGGRRERTRAVARRLLAAIATTDSSIIWGTLAPGAIVSFPFLHLEVTDQAVFDVTVGPFLADLDGFTLSEPMFTDLDDEDAAIIRYSGHGIVGSTGKPYDQTYISELHVVGDLVASYTEYFDTAVIRDAFTP